MTDTWFTVDAGDIGGVIIPGGAEVRKVVPADGRITIRGLDAASFIQAGARFVSTRTTNQAPNIAPRAASAGRIVASAALSNGTLSIANQPDVPRQAVLRIDPGTSALSAGVVTLTYIGNDGGSHVEALSVVTPASTVASTLTTYGVVSLTSAVVTAVAGGASPKVQVNDTNSLSMELSPNYAGFNVRAQYADGVVETPSAVATVAASYTPSTTPNGTHTYSAVAQFTSR